MTTAPQPSSLAKAKHDYQANINLNDAFGDLAQGGLDYQTASKPLPSTDRKGQPAGPAANLINSSARSLSSSALLRAAHSRRVRRRAHQPALRFFTVFLVGACAVPGVVFSGDLRLARSASIKLTTLLGAGFLCRGDRLHFGSWSAIHVGNTRQMRGFAAEGVKSKPK